MSASETKYTRTLQQYWLRRVIHAHSTWLTRSRNSISEKWLADMSMYVCCVSLSQKKMLQQPHDSRVLAADAVVGRVQAHLEAGADHVCVQLRVDSSADPALEGYRELAAALLAL